MTEKIGYKLNPNKLKGAPQSILPFVCGAFYYTEDYEYFDVIKPYLDIPAKPKSLEEIEKELDEKFEKLKSILPFVCGAFYYTEDYEYFDVIKPYLDIPAKPKSLEEIEKELDEKFEKLIEKTHLEYRIGHNWLYKLRRYEEFCKKQNEDFEYAKTYGYFPQKPKFTIGTTLSANSNITSTFVIKQGNKHEGYYTIGNGYLRFYMPYKPNAITRWFMDKCVSIRWVDEK